MKKLITSALPYINGVKHLGNLTGSMLPADVYARFCRRNGDEVLYICATDEHGTPAEISATEAGLSVAEYCAKQHKVQLDMYIDFDISFDWFGRTSGRNNHKLTQDIAIKLEQAGFLEERKSDQVFSIDDQRYLPDRYIEGECPKCAYTSARGDQCDNCGSLMEPTELINPRSKLSGSTNLEIRKTAHLYLRQDLLADDIRKWVTQSTAWASLAKSIALKWLDEGLRARAITRDLDWGIPVVDEKGNPRKGFEEKVYYVWFDAPIGYISATVDWADDSGSDWEDWWRSDHGVADVEYVQFMGKDNVAFHTVSFPASLIGSGSNWKLVDRIKAFNWVNWYGKKFSTSENRGIFLDNALELLPTDCWRWYLMSNAPEKSDFSFTWPTLLSAVNSDLANNYGNFVNRSVKFAIKNFESAVPQPGEYDNLDRELCANLTKLLGELSVYYENIEIKKAAMTTRKIWSLANEYFAKKQPWTSVDEDTEHAATAIYVSIQLCAIIAIVNEPIMPKSSVELSKMIGFQLDKVSEWPREVTLGTLEFVSAGNAMSFSGSLFNKIDEKWLSDAADKYGSDS